MVDTPRSLGSVLVVGGCGFLGSRIVRQLLKSHNTTPLAVVDIDTNRVRLPNVSYHDLDISSREDVESIFRQLRPNTVFHTAAPKPFSSPKSSFEKINVGGTRNLLEAAQDTRSVKAFIYTSSSGVIHDSVSNLADVDETWPVLYKPIQKSVYVHSKAVAEDLVLRANRQNGAMLTTSLRPSGMFGEDDPSIVKPMIEAAASGKYRYQIGNGQNLFDWTYVGNAAAAHIQAAHILTTSHSKPPTQIPNNRRVDGEAFLITNGEPMAFWEFARVLGAAAGHPTKEEDIRTIPVIVGLVMAAIAEWIVWVFSFGRKESSVNVASVRYSTINRTFRIEKAKSRLGYRPEVGMAEGIRRAGESFSKKEM